MNWNPGDKVRLISGGPTMSVQGCTKDGVNCCWFYKTESTYENDPHWGSLSFGVFHPDSLVPAEDSE